jgi:hypothetical protein
MYREYRLDVFKEEKGGGADNIAQPKQVPKATTAVPKTAVKPSSKTIFTTLPTVTQLPVENEAYTYALSRKLPMATREMYYAEKFVDWTKRHTDKFAKWRGKDHSRIIFPFRNRRGKIIGYTARALNGEEPKYYRIFTDESEDERFFGIDKLDESKQVFVVEGEVDSMMLPNAIATSNGKLTTYDNKNAIYIPDADKRNPQIVKGIETMINKGYRVCLLPDDIAGKDLNDFVRNGMSKLQLLKMIRDNTLVGLKAKLKFNNWRKC